MSVKFSIILPTYNRAHLISSPIESIINQTYSNWELIIIDDGSTDNTKDIVESYGDDRIVYVWQTNQERSAARNHGIELARGQWICFLDSDDRYHCDYLNVLNREIVKNDVIIRTMMVYINEEGEAYLTTPNYKNESNQQYFVALTLRSILHFSFKREILAQYKFANINLNEDVELLLRILNDYSFRSIEFTSVYALNHLERSINEDINIDNLISMFKIFNETVDKSTSLSRKQKKVIIDNRKLTFLYKSVFANYDSIFLLKKLNCFTPKFVIRMLYYKMLKFKNHG